MAYRILIVDDEPELANVIAFELEDVGYETICAFSGVEALDIALSKPFDLIVSDIRMPKGDGVTLLKQIKLKLPLLPVVLISGFSDYEDQELLNLGAIRVLKKPQDLAEIKSIVDSILRKNSPPLAL